MTPVQFQQRILMPCIFAFPFKDNPQSRSMLFAIAGQESLWTSRVQEGGPARGFWQFEQGTVASRGGIAGLILHPLSAPILKQFCADWELPFNVGAIHEAIAYCDPLAYACARLLLWTDPYPLPQVGSISASWDYYERNWRPGRPRRDAWNTNYALAMNPPTLEA